MSRLNPSARNPVFAAFALNCSGRFSLMSLESNSEVSPSRLRVSWYLPRGSCVSQTALQLSKTRPFGPSVWSAVSTDKTKSASKTCSRSATGSSRRDARESARAVPVTSKGKIARAKTQSQLERLHIRRASPSSVASKHSSMHVCKWRAQNDEHSSNIRKHRTHASSQPNEVAQHLLASSKHCSTLNGALAPLAYNRGSTGSLSRASTLNTHACTRCSGSLSTKRCRPSSPSASSWSASARLWPRPQRLPPSGALSLAGRARQIDDAMRRRSEQNWIDLRAWRASSCATGDRARRTCRLLQRS